MYPREIYRRSPNSYDRATDHLKKNERWKWAHIKVHSWVTIQLYWAHLKLIWPLRGGKSYYKPLVWDISKTTLIKIIIIIIIIHY